jgi:pimeloyl-ACP methyl ester carboxylesterase
MASSPLVAEWQGLGSHETVRGERVFVVDAPSLGSAVAPPLLVVHGFPTSSIDFAAALPRLRANRRVLLLDLPGFGGSDKPDRPYSLFDQADVVAGIAVAHGLGEVDLLTHDMGDSVGGELLARGLEGRLGFEVRRRVLTNGSIYLDLAHLTDGQKLLASLPDEGLAPGLEPSPDALTASLVATMAPGTTATAAAGLDAAVELIVRGGGHRLLPRLIRYLAERREHEGRWTGAIESHPAPLTIVWGDLDPIAVWAMTDRLLERRPDAVRTRLDGVGHFPMLETPDAYAQAVVDGL